MIDSNLFCIYISISLQKEIMFLSFKIVMQ